MGGIKETEPERARTSTARKYSISGRRMSGAGLWDQFSVFSFWLSAGGGLRLKEDGRACRHFTTRSVVPDWAAALTVLFAGDFRIIGINGQDSCRL